jgi:hypothetical protein
MIALWWVFAGVLGSSAVSVGFSGHVFVLVIKINIILFFSNQISIE